MAKRTMQDVHNQFGSGTIGNTKAAIAKRQNQIDNGKKVINERAALNTKIRPSKTPAESAMDARLKAARSGNKKTLDNMNRLR